MTDTVWLYSAAVRHHEGDSSVLLPLLSYVYIW